MEDYCVIKFDDGYLMCSQISKLRVKNGQHSARWKNTWYQVTIIINGDKMLCDNFVETENKEHAKPINNQDLSITDPVGCSNTSTNPAGK